MRMKTIIGGMIAVVLFVGGYFGYKGYNWFIYNSGGYEIDSVEELYQNLVFKDTIHIKTQPTTEYLKFQNFNVKNVVQKFERPDDLNDMENFSKYVLYDDDRKMIASFWIGVSESNVERFQTDEVMEDFPVGITNKDMIAFFKKHKITNDIELFEYLSQQKIKKDHLFTSVKQMKENYIIRNILSSAIPSIDSLTKIEGDKIGYILNMQDKVKQVSILEQDKCYILTFFGLDYFDDATIQDILNSIVIEEA